MYNTGYELKNKTSSAEGGITMHDTTNVIKRSDLTDKVRDIVELYEKDYRWLIPFSRTLQKRSIAMVPKKFLLKNVTGSFETIWLVEEVQVGKIRISEYIPDCTNKMLRPKSSQKDRESPFAISTIRFVLGDVTLEHYEGDDKKKEMALKNVIERVLPVILYFQQFADKVTVKKVRIKGKKGNNQNRYTLYELKNKLPESYCFLGKVYDLVSPENDLDESVLRKEGAICIIDHPNKFAWLQGLADNVRKKMGIYGKSKTPFFDKYRDLDAKISAFRCYTEDGKDYMQVTIHKINAETWQLDYYDEEKNGECQMIILLDLGMKRKPCYEITYIAGDGRLTDEMDEYAKKICNLLLNILIYLRIYSWEDAKNEAGVYCDCDIIEYPSSIFGRKVKYF